MRHLLFLLSFSPFVYFSQNEKLVTVKGYAPAYVGQTVSINEIEDYFSMKETPYATATVKEDSTFTLSFFADETQKVFIRGNKNKGQLYIQPGGTYDIFLPDKDKYEPFRPNGNLVEVSFFGLDSLDINYKILRFYRWMDEFMSEYYHLRTVKPMEFALKLDQFKVDAEKYYGFDDSLKVAKFNEPEKYFSTFVKFSIAQLDNIQYAADRNRYEKHDFYIKHSPVSYRNDAYMAYFSTFYEKMIPRLSLETNNRVYLGVLKSSPTLIMRALGSDYTLINLRIREMVMIKALSEEFYSKDFPQTNILTILDSVANHPMFKSNGILAKNMISRLTELVPGGKAPDFVLKNSEGTMKTNSFYTGKYLYIQFYDPKSQKNFMEIGPLKQLHDKYKEDIVFITVYPTSELDSVTRKEHLDIIPWEKYSADNQNPIWKNYKVETYPYYVLIDPYGYVVGAPALSPMPNGQYETIDRTFFSIQKALKQLREEQR